MLNVQQVNPGSGRRDVEAQATPQAVFSFSLQSAVSTEIFHRNADSGRDGGRRYDTSLRGRGFSGSAHVRDSCGRAIRPSDDIPVTSG